MKKIALALSTLLMTACGSQTLPQAPQLRGAAQPNIQRLSTPRATSAQSGLAIALDKVKQVDPSAQLYEIDVWQEATGKSMHYGFLSNNQPDALRVIINAENQQVSLINAPQGSQSQLINRDHWKIDSDAIYARAQQNGLRDTYYLATLWENTWHISGLKQDLYFQMDSQSGAIQLRCLGPYLNNCTDADGSPVQRLDSPGRQQHLQARQSAR